MNNLNLFQFLSSFIQDLLTKPFRLFPGEKQKEHREQLKNFIIHFSAYLYLKQLQDSPLKNVLNTLKNSCFKKQIKENEELLIVKAIKNFLEFYQDVNDRNLREQIKNLLSTTFDLYNLIKKYPVYLKLIEEHFQKLTQKEIIKSDQFLLKQAGLFYLLEYYLQMYFELTHAKSTKITEHLIEKDETKIPKGTLMGLRFEMSSREFLTRLTYKIYDEKLREKLIKIFYTFNEQMQTKDYPKLIEYFQDFIREFLQIFKSQNIKKTSSIIYNPYGHEPTIEILLKLI